jgi:hypothetical protein
MPATLPSRPSGRTFGPALLLLLTACAGEVAPSGDDPGCFGVFDVPAWKVSLRSSVDYQSDSGGIALRLHQRGTVSSAIVRQARMEGELAEWAGDGSGEVTGTIHDTLLVPGQDPRVITSAPTSTLSDPPEVVVLVDRASCTIRVGASYYIDAWDTGSGNVFAGPVPVAQISTGPTPITLITRSVGFKSGGMTTVQLVIDAMYADYPAVVPGGLRPTGYLVPTQLGTAKLYWEVRPID